MCDAYASSVFARKKETAGSPSSFTAYSFVHTAKYKARRTSKVWTIWRVYGFRRHGGYAVLIVLKIFDSFGRGKQVHAALKRFCFAHGTSSISEE